MRDEINEALKTAMKARDPRRTGTLRMVNAAIKNAEIEARGSGRGPISDEDILGLLQKMMKQREESLSAYEGAGRTDLATQEREEIAIIQAFLPQPLNADELGSAIDAAVAETGATTVKDMGKVVAVLRAGYPGRIDFGQASKLVKARLGG
jgi:hypothetical protein